jgi:splicing suppressor protein 51
MNFADPPSVNSCGVNSTSSTDICAKCTKPGSSESPLQRCSRCKSTRYCSLECQKAHWKTHKKACLPASDVEAHITGSENPKTAKPSSDSDWEDIPETDRRPSRNPRSSSTTSPLLTQHWTGLSEELSFFHIIDAYRLRVEDEYVFSGSTRGIYNQDPALPDFRRFLNKAEKRQGLLPGWWSNDKRRECEKLAKKRGAGAEIDGAVEASDVVERYGDPTILMFLRLFAERVELRSAMAVGF